MSTIKTTNITHGSNSGTANMVLASDGKVTIPEKKLYCPGGVVQVVSVAKTDSFSTSSTSAVDVTGLTLDITPTASSSKVLVFFSAWASVAGDQHGVHVELHRDSTKIGDNYNQYPSVQSQTGGTVFNQVLDSPNTTSAVTYKVKIKTDDASRTARIGAGSNDGTTNIPDSVITLMEIAA